MLRCLGFHVMDMDHIMVCLNAIIVACYPSLFGVLFGVCSMVLHSWFYCSCFGVVFNLFLGK